MQIFLSSLQQIKRQKNGFLPELRSEKYANYEQNALCFLPNTLEPINYPVNIKCLFYMENKRKCDLVNLQEATLDVLVKGRIIEDDNFTIVQSMDGSRVLYDKENPRTEIEITASPLAHRQA